MKYRLSELVEKKKPAQPATEAGSQIYHSPTIVVEWSGMTHPTRHPELVSGSSKSAMEGRLSAEHVATAEGADFAKQDNQALPKETKTRHLDQLSEQGSATSEPGSSYGQALPATLLITARSASSLEIIDDLALEGILNIEICSQQEAPVTYLWVRGESDGAQKSPSRHVTARCATTGGSISIRCARQTFGSQQVELHTVQHHTASHTTSNVQIHGVSSDRSRMTVTSMIHIGPGICGVTAHQIHKHLLLDKGARATSKPMLEVLSDDVSCSHGAAIKALDERQLFYLQSRGCAPESAREMLINAFLEA